MSDTSNPPVLETSRLTRTYAGADEPIRVLAGIDLTLRKGETLAICGPSGSGKSTLLHILGGLDRPTAGSVRVEGVELSGLREDQLADLRNRRIGFVFQFHHLLPQFSVLENVLLPRLAAGKVDKAAADRAKRLLEAAGLGARMHHRPGEISGGERQRAAVVRALVPAPAIVLADEPTGSLDHATAMLVGGMLIDLNRGEGTALVLATHSLELAARMSRTATLRDGFLTE